jgi:hypothetical protein
MVSRSVASILEEHTTYELECIDRMYLNGYVRNLMYPEGVAGFLRRHRKCPFVSTAAVAPMTRQFVGAIERFAETEGLDLIRFPKGERKDDIALRYQVQADFEEGVLFIGKAQELAPVPRTERRRNPETGSPYAWIVRGTALVNYYYFYVLDRDFGPMFLKFCSYFPYTMKICLNGHEWLKCQLRKRGLRFEALDNGLLSCENPKAAQRIANQLDDRKIERLIRKWLRLLPDPFSAADHQAGYCYEFSMLQTEFALTQVLDRPLTGRLLFEEIIRENLDLGRPDVVQLIFQRRISRRTPGSFRTRVVTEGVEPTLRIQYKATRTKQYHKEGRALRTETTINDTRDFRIGRRLHNLPALREIGFQANRRLLDVERLSHDCAIGESEFTSLHQGTVCNDQRASALRFGDPRVQSLFLALLVFRLVSTGFSNRELRELLAPLLGLDPATYKPSRMTYDLRRLRLHGLIQRIPGRNRYHVTDRGFRIAYFYSRSHSRLFRTVLSPTADPDLSPTPPRTATRLHRLNQAMDQFLAETHLQDAA